MKCVVLFLSILGFGCGPMNVQLSRGASNIEIVGVDASIEGCKFVGNFNARIGSNFQSYDSNVGLAENSLRNQAAARGATHMIISPPQQQGLTAWTNDCRNCVQMSARAFRCK